MKATLNINLAKLRHNAQHLLDMCNQHGIMCAFVTKCACADQQIVSTLADTQCAILADSRIENIASYPPRTQQSMLLRMITADECDEAVKTCDIICCSSAVLLAPLNDSAKAQGKVTKVLLMIDCGDLREGIFYTEKALIEEFCEQVKRCENLTFVGVGTNLTCYGGILPDQHNMQCLLDIAELVKSHGLQCDIISGGNSSAIEFLRVNKMPVGINNLRIGEALFLGRETAYGKAIDNMYNDCITLSVSIIECYVKPSYPIGTIAMNAFGEHETYVDRGLVRRAICAVGRQDTDISGLTPCDQRITIIGGSSDHLIIDVSNAPEYDLDKSVEFRLGYKALLDCFTSKYVTRKYIQANE